MVLRRRLPDRQKGTRGDMAWGGSGVLLGQHRRWGGARSGRVWETWGSNARSLGESERIRRSVCRVSDGVGAVGGRGVSNACTADRVECWCSRWGVRRS